MGKKVVPQKGFLLVAVVDAVVAVVAVAVDLADYTAVDMVAAVVLHYHYCCCSNQRADSTATLLLCYPLFNTDDR